MLNVGDRCTCSVQSGTFDVMEKKGHGRSAQVRLRNCSNMNETFWIYEALCTLSTAQKFENLKNKRLAREAVINRILSKPKR